MSFSKPNPFYLTNRSNSQTIRDLRKTTSSMEKLIPFQRREKLKNLLIVKFMKKYGLKNPEKVLEEEVAKFLKGEKLSDNDLRKFDSKIKGIIESSRTQENLVRNLANSCSLEDLPNAKLPDLNNDNMSVRSNVSKHSKISGHSKLSHFSEHKRGILPTKPKDDDYDFDNISLTSVDSRVNRPPKLINFEGDNWDLIAKYNQKKFEEEKKENKLKDKEIKRRLKDDLDLQMREKMLRSNEEVMKNREFDMVVLQHVENMNRLEKEKEQVVKDKILKEKFSRDVQLKDEAKKKKVEEIKNKKFEKEIGKFIIYSIITLYLLSINSINYFYSKENCRRNCKRKAKCNQQKRRRESCVKKTPRRK